MRPTRSAVTSRRSARRSPTRTPRACRAYVTGEAAFAADQSAALEGIDETLLLVTLALVIVILLLIYRSPIVALVPVFVVGVAYVVASALRLRGGAGRALSGHRTGDRDPDRPDVRRGHGLLPAAARPLPRGIRPAGRDGDRAEAHRPGDRLGRRDRDRGDAGADRRRLQRHALDGPGAGDRHGDHRARRRDAAARARRGARRRARSPNTASRRRSGRGSGAWSRRSRWRSRSACS